MCVCLKELIHVCVLEGINTCVRVLEGINICVPVLEGINTCVCVGRN